MSDDIDPYIGEMNARVTTAIQTEVKRQINAILTYYDARDVATAAFDAMRVPTETMLVAARNWSQEKFGKSMDDKVIIEFFQTMIDEAKK